MTRDQIRREVDRIFADDVTYPAWDWHRKRDVLADFILENFVEKPKLTAVERLTERLGVFGVTTSRAIAEHLFANLPLLKDIIAERDCEIAKQYAKGRFLI